MKLKYRYLPFDAGAIAYKGYEYASDPGLAWLAKEKMAPVTPSSRISKKSYPGPYTPEFMKRRSIRGTPHSARSSAMETNTARESGNNQSSKPAVKKIKKKGVTIKKKPSVKVSKEFRKKVLKVGEPGKIFGHKTDIQSTMTIGNIPANAQLVETSNFGADPYTAWAFTPEYFLDACSVLWNGKTPTYAAYQWTDTNNLGINPSAGSVPTYPDIKFTVHSSWEKYLIKNNTQRTIVCKILLCAPKSTGVINQTGENPQQTSGTRNDAYIGNPALVWDIALAADYTAGMNVANVTKGYLGLLPTSSPSWSNVYKSDYTEVVLEPGETYDYFIQGPTDLNIDFMKYVKNGTVETIQKYCRYPLMVWHTDLAGSSTGSTLGRAPHNNTVGAYVICERKRYVKVSMPEQVGILDQAVPALGTIIRGQNLRRRSTYAYYNWSLDPTGDVKEVFEQTELFGTAL